MKKLLLVFALFALLLTAGAVQQVRAEDAVADEGEEVIVEEPAEEPEEEIVYNGGNLLTILANQCTDEHVEYTPWGECDTRFGKFGFQFRNIIYPTNNGCTPKAIHQVNQIRVCYSDIFGIE